MEEKKSLAAVIKSSAYINPQRNAEGSRCAGEHKWWPCEDTWSYFFLNKIKGQIPCSDDQKHPLVICLKSF